VTAEDPDFDQPYTDVDEWRDHPIRHRYATEGLDFARLGLGALPTERERYAKRTSPSSSLSRSKNSDSCCTKVFWPSSP
jgi:hypothetical protein